VLVLALMLLAQMQKGVELVLPSEQKMLSGPVRACSAELDPQLGTYKLVLWMPRDEQKWYWTWLEEPFRGRTHMSGCTQRTDQGCKQKWEITRFAPYSSANVVPDAYKVAFTCERCYHAFWTQGGQSRDLCYTQGGK